MINNKEKEYVTPEMEVMDIMSDSAVLQGSDSPSDGYADNDLGTLS